MKMVIIAYNEALDEEVLEALETCCDLVEFTKWTQVMGQGRHSEPHLISHVWPKANNVLMTCVDDAKGHKIMERIREMRKTMARQGIKAFLLPVEDVT
jgi:nitrogen regulatory protein PII